MARRDMEERLIELEIRYTHQQRMLDELNDVIIAQGRQIDRLQDELKVLRARVDAGPDEPAEEGPPPHY
jgi:SlyX protein